MLHMHVWLHSYFICCWWNPGKTSIIIDYLEFLMKEHNEHMKYILFCYSLWLEIIRNDAVNTLEPISMYSTYIHCLWIVLFFKHTKNNTSDGDFWWSNTFCEIMVPLSYKTIFFHVLYRSSFTKQMHHYFILKY